MCSTTSFRATNSFPTTVALATNLTNQSTTRPLRHRETNNKPSQRNARKQTAIDCLIVTLNSCTKANDKFEMDVTTINNLEIAHSSVETRQLIARWRDFFKPGIYRQFGGRWKKNHEPKFLRNERRILEEQLLRSN